LPSGAVVYKNVSVEEMCVKIAAADEVASELDLTFQRVFSKENECKYRRVSLNDGDTF
jgi:hypothetical protein